MRWWETSVGGKVRGRIIGMLRRRERTVEEIAAELAVTDNAVRSQLQALEREGLVHQARLRRTGAVGKPATLYAIAPDAEPLFSAAHAPVLSALLAALQSHLSERQMDALFRDAGRRLAASVDDGDVDIAPTTLEARVNGAAQLLTSLGGEVDVEQIPDGYRIRGHACPLADAVRVQPTLCHALEELLAGVTGGQVHECCDRTDGIKCRFEIKRSA